MCFRTPLLTLTLSKPNCWQVFSYTFKNELRREDLCVDGISKDGADVNMHFCHGHQGNQEWIYDKEIICHYYYYHHCCPMHEYSLNSNNMFMTYYKCLEFVLYCNGGWF